VRSYIGDEIFKRRHVIGQWFWELEEFPDSFRGSFDLVNEVWTPTSFVADAIRLKAPEGVPVRTVHLPLERPATDPTVTKHTFGLTDRFVFLFMFDFLSVFKRKNPLGVIHAFRTAFGNDEGPVLVLKSINGSKRQREREQMKWAARGRKDIIFLDAYFDSVMNASLVASSDCYVSLHRSEGLGLTLADAMTLGKPVIATGYSGNLEFMNTGNSVLVPYSEELVGLDAAPYSHNAKWADPDLDFAADAMRRVASDSVFATRLGLQAEEDLLTNFNASITGQRMRDAIVLLT
jgi:glycosyltransferase involved in cell wall biosynthesis